MSEPLPEIVPEKLSDDIDLVLVVTAPERDGMPFAMVLVPTGHGNHEEQARALIGSYDHQRFSTMVRVRVPRSMLRERWKEAGR